MISQESWKTWTKAAATCRAAGATHAARVAVERDALEDAVRERAVAAEARQIAQAIAAEVQTRVHTRVAAIVNRCLTAVFDEPYEFKILFEQKRGRTEASLVFMRDGVAVDPMSAAGGGVVDIAAFGLRLACLALTRPQRRRLLVMDEPFRFVSVGHRPRVRAMVAALADEMGFQFIYVTHIPELVVGNVIEV